MRRGCLLVVSGPSGVGKGTLCNMLLEMDDRTVFSVSATTRAPREGEIDGVHYHFVDEKTFRDMIEQNAFLEYANLYGMGRYYGTPKEKVDQRLDEGYDVVLDIDVQGAMNIKKQMDDAVLVFIAPPSLDELQSRLQKRSTETQEQIEKRMQVAKSEMRTASEYDYIIVNDDLQDAILSLQTILNAERLKIVRNQRWLQKFWEDNSI